MGLQHGQDGKTHFEGKNLTIEHEVVPDSRDKVEVEVLDVKSKEPINEEKIGGNVKCFEMTEQVWKQKLEIFVELVDSQLDL